MTTLIQRLRSAHDSEELNGIVLDNSLLGLEPELQDKVRWVAIPHWFDASFLEQLGLASDDEEALKGLLRSLSQLSFIEELPDFGWNVHELSRHTILRKLWSDDSAWFRATSRQIADYFYSRIELGVPWQIEHVYHALVADPTTGLSFFNSCVEEWRSNGREDWIDALTKSCLELVEGQRTSESAAHTISALHSASALLYGRRNLDTGDQEFVRRFLAGEREPVTEVEQWLRRSTSSYRRRLGRKYEPVLQEVRRDVRRLLSEGNFGGDSSLKTYLWRVAAHTCLDHLKLQSKWSFVDYENEETATPPEKAWGAERELLLRVLANTEEECRRLWSQLIEGLSYAEISAETGVSEGVLRVRVLRCRERAQEVRRRILSSRSVPE